MLIVFVLLAAVVCTENFAAAEDVEPVAADRPGISDPPTVLKPRVGQLEFGVAFTHDSAFDDSRSLFITTARLGIGHRLEMRVVTDGIDGETISGRGTTWGRADVAVGVKVRITDDLALIPMVSLPIGSAGLSSDGFDTTFKVAWQHHLTTALQVSGEGYVSEENDAGYLGKGGAGIGLSRDLPWRLNAFGELHGIEPAQRGSGPDWTFDTGVSRAVKKDIQVDVSVGRGLSDASSRWFVATGFVVRHRPH